MKETISKNVGKTFKVEKDILFYALRYSIGRQTFAPAQVVDNFKYNLELFNDNDLRVIIKEIDDTTHFGMRSDELFWKSFKSFIEAELNTRNTIKLD